MLGLQGIERIKAVAKKEWRLNLRFPMEYFASNLVSPIKNAVLMYLLYRGFLKGSENSLGVLNGENFQVFVILGTTCHSLFNASMQTFRFKMITEKYWMTIMATLVSPASILEVIAGFILGSIAIHLFVGALILCVTAYFFSIPLAYVGMGILCLFLVSLLGFGFGLIGTTISLVWEGKTYLFDYALQAVAFLSCFYYPVETLPVSLHGVVKVLPTYQASQLIQTLYLSGIPADFATLLGYVVVSSLLILCIPAFFLDYSMKKYGIVGY